MEKKEKRKERFRRNGKRPRCMHKLEIGERTLTSAHERHDSWVQQVFAAEALSPSSYRIRHWCSRYAYKVEEERMR